MGLPESYFWESTPRKIIALIDQKKEIEKVKEKNLAIYIASYVWGNEPEEESDGKKKPIPGIDVPIDSETVNLLF